MPSPETAHHVSCCVGGGARHNAALARMNHLLDFWWLYVGAFGSALYFWHALRRRGGNEPLPRRLIFSASPKHDPKSPEYDPGLLGRQLVLVVVGLGVVALVQLVVWLISGE